MNTPVEVTYHSFSMLSMFLKSDLFMQMLILLLLFASVWSWSIIFEKISSFKKIRERTKAFEEKFLSGLSFDSLYQSLGNVARDPMSAIFMSAMKEWRRSIKQVGNFSPKDVSFQDRLDKVMEITIEKEIDSLEKHMTFLASTGSVAPLLGLFGTVWGIMNSFNAIGLSQSTNIAAVAPGVAEALFTTAVGLIAAIPAVLAYNKLSHDIERFTKQMDSFAGELSTILSRQTEQKKGEA
ncbi:MAG: protein TolQ [Alphaproteobacteria bacterium]|nr:protein TolQ [Alphaproteobacteria bacterium]